MFKRMINRALGRDKADKTDGFANVVTSAINARGSPTQQQGNRSVSRSPVTLMNSSVLENSSEKVCLRKKLKTLQNM